MSQEESYSSGLREGKGGLCPELGHFPGVPPPLHPYVVGTLALKKWKGDGKLTALVSG